MENIFSNIHYLSIDDTYSKLKEIDPETGAQPQLKKVFELN